MSKTWEEEQKKYAEAHKGMKEVLDAYVAELEQPKRKGVNRYNKIIQEKYRMPKMSESEFKELIEAFLNENSEQLDEGIKKTLATFGIAALMAVNLFAGGVKNSIGTNAPVLGASTAIGIAEEVKEKSNGGDCAIVSRNGKDYLFVSVFVGNNWENLTNGAKKSNEAVKKFCQENNIDLEKITATEGVRGQTTPDGYYVTIYQLIPDTEVSPVQ